MTNGTTVGGESARYCDISANFYASGQRLPDVELDGRSMSSIHTVNEITTMGGRGVVVVVHGFASPRPIGT